MSTRYETKIFLAVITMPTLILLVSYFAFYDKYNEFSEELFVATGDRYYSDVAIPLTIGLILTVLTFTLIEKTMAYKNKHGK